MSKREAFLQATDKDSVEAFLHYIELHKNASDPFDLEELLQELQRKQKEELWEKLKTLLRDTLIANPLEGWQTLDDESDDDMEVESVEKQTIAIIHGVTIVTTSSLSAIDEHVNYEALLECAGILNGILQAIPTSETTVHRAIQQLCEAWWEKDLQGKQDFGKTAFLLALNKSLQPKSSGADIARLWNRHSALLCFDYSSDDHDVKSLLLQCVMNSRLIRKEEGRRFLSFLFSWNVAFIKVIHGTIKNQLSGIPRSLCRCIAEIYFRAWQKASGDCLKTLEYDCIQDFMHHGVYLPRKSPVQPKVHEVLRYFHQQNIRHGSDEMLNRLYQPIMWRALKATNSEVRSNAAMLFVEVFPLRDPKLRREDFDNELQRQLEELFSLLDDPHPLVRCTGVLGVCKVAGKHWEVIPPSILMDFLKKILGDLAADTSSADVRCAVFKSLPVLLENKHSHLLLEKMLPAVRNSLHDNSEKVRVAVVDMLLKIKAVKAAKFWRICPMEHLLARLEGDTRVVCRRLVHLLFNSFFPVDQPEEVWCERCVTLVQMNPSAARRFYQYAFEHTSPTIIAKLMFTLRRCLNACVYQAVQEDDGGLNDSEKENQSVLVNVLSADDTASMASLLEIIVILWKSIQNALDSNDEANAYIIKKFAASLPQYFKFFKDERCVVPLILLASFMPASAVPTFSCSVLSKLRHLETGADEKRYSILIDCLCRWGQLGHVLELISEWLSETLPDKKSQKEPARKVRVLDNRGAKPELALDYIEYIVTHTMNRECLLSMSTKKLNQFLKVLELAKEALLLFITPAVAVTQMINQRAALRTFSLYCRLTIHLQHKFASEGRTYLTNLEDTGKWIENQILVNFESSASISEEQCDIAQQVVKEYLAVCKDVLMVGLGDPEFQTRLLQMILSVVQTDKFPDCLPLLQSILKEVTDTCLVHTRATSNVNTEMLETVQKVFHKSLEMVARRLRRPQDEGLQLLQSLQAPLGNFINYVQCWRADCPALHHGMLSTVMAAMVVEIGHALRKLTDLSELAIPEHISDLPPLSRCLMTTLVKSPRVLSSFLGELTDCIVSEEVEGIFSLTASLYIAYLSQKGSKASAASKDLALAAYRKLKNFSELTMEDVDSKERAVYESSMKIIELMHIHSA
ncbi:condensin-2 complex subunit G2 [Pelodytes ibericus]